MSLFSLPAQYGPKSSHAGPDPSKALPSILHPAVDQSYVSQHESPIDATENYRDLVPYKSGVLLHNRQ